MSNFYDSKLVYLGKSIELSLTDDVMLTFMWELGPNISRFPIRICSSFRLVVLFYLWYEIYGSYLLKINEDIRKFWTYEFLFKPLSLLLS